MLNKLKVMIFGGMPDKDRRRLPRAGTPPKSGAHIAKQNVAIKLTEPMHPDLWDWFVLMGWREVNMKTNKRKMHTLPRDTYMQIAKASASERETVYSQLIKVVK